MTTIAKIAAKPFSLNLFSIGSIIRLNQAYIAYRKFKSLDAQQMHDMGFDATQVRCAKLSDFL